MRRPAKIALWSIATPVLLLLVLLAVVLLGANTDAGRAAIERLTARLTGGTVQLQGLTGQFPTRLSVAHLRLTDDRGVWLSADQVTVEWSPAALLAKRVSVQSLRAASVSMARLPHSAPSASPSNAQASMPRIDIDKADFDHVDLGAELAGTETVLSLHGDARMRSVSEMQFDVTAQRLNGAGDYDVHLKFDAKRMQTVMKIHEPANGPLQNIMALPGLGDAEVSLNFDGPRSAEKLQLTLKVGTLAGHAEGSLNLADFAADLNFEFESAAMQPRAGLDWSHLAARGRWLGSLKTLNATAHVAVADLHTPGEVLLKSLNVEVSAENGVASLRGALSGLQIPGPRPTLLAADPIKLDATMHLEQETRPLQIALDHRLLSLRARWQTAGRQQATWQLHLADLTPFAALAGQRASGNADVRGQLEYAEGLAQVSLSADANLEAGAQSVINMLGRRVTVQLAGTWSPDAIAVDKFNIAGGALTAAASGNFALAKRNLRAKWDLSVNDLATLSPLLAGTLSASGSAQGPSSALAIEAQADSKLAVRGGSSGEISAKIALQGVPSAPAGTLSVEGSLDGSPLQAEAAVQREAQGVVHAIIKQVNWRSAHLDGDVTTKLSDGGSNGHASLQIGQLRDLQHLLGFDAAGALSASLDLSPDAQHTRLKLQLSTQDLTVGALAAAVQLSGAGPSDAFEFKVDAKLPKVGLWPAALDGAGTLDLDKSSIALASLTANYNGQDIRLLAPAHLEFANGLSVDALRLGAQQAQLAIQGRAFPDTALTVSLSNLGPPLVNAFVPNLLAAGRIDAHAELHDSLQTPTGQVSVKAVGVRSADDAALGLPAADLSADAQLMGSTADIHARLVAGTGSELTVSGHAPISFDGALDLKIAGKLPLSLLNPILEARGQHAEGSLDVNASVAGSVAQPEIGGSATLTQGNFRDYGRGLSLTAINGELVGSAATLQVKSFSATAAPGSLSVSGSIGALQPKMPIDLKITARNAQPVVSKLVTSNFDADLHVGGTLAERLEVGGTVHLNRTLIGIPNSLPPNVAVLDVRRRGTAARRTPSKPLVIALDVRVRAPQQILVQGRGLDAEMGGELHISGTAADPRVSGDFRLQRGTFTLASSRLNFTPDTSRITFSGEGLQNKIDPTLDFTAETSIPQGTATLHIGGFADAPQFELTSSPALPQDEIMARLMFGESASQLSGLQLAQIGYALASLSGVGGNGDANPLVKIQKTLGLDRLSIGSGPPTSATGTDTGTSIAAGRYISKRVYVEAKQTTTGNSQLEADIDLTKRLKLQTKLGNGTASVQGTTPDNDPGSSIGLSYQFEY
jgi:translocation and assembly module TamB